ncbi:MAG: hypothetical protein AUJ51_12395 [Elusimicrobia bacterium CG1_02_56_21]|nr:MAG: hypothetical protein AUJ51_12395 [Elusimicrobia bacterium CG1_02_56_21]
MNLLLTLILSGAPGGAVAAGDFGDIGMSVRESLAESRQGGDLGIMPSHEAMPGNQKGAGIEVKDDLKGAVLSHLDKTLAYCDAHMDECNGPDGSVRAFAKTIGNGRCNNRGYNCINGVLEMCKAQLEDDDVTPMYYMACGVMLGKLGERDCAKGKASCAGHLQGSVYFSLRAAAGCHKSFENDKARQAVADKLVDNFAKVIKRDIKGIYVAGAEESSTVGHHLVWHAGKEAGIIGTEKVLEFAFERLAMHTAGAAVSAAGVPIFVASSFLLFHEIAASEMNNLVCLQWSHYYNGSYANAAGSITKMSGYIK